MQPYIRQCTTGNECLHVQVREYRRPRESASCLQPILSVLRSEPHVCILCNPSYQASYAGDCGWNAYRKIQCMYIFMHTLSHGSNLPGMQWECREENSEPLFAAGQEFMQIPRRTMNYNYAMQVLVPDTIIIERQR